MEDNISVSEQVNQIIATADYQQKIQQLKEANQECTSNLQAVTSLSYGLMIPWQCVNLAPHSENCPCQTGC